ncbi:MAG: DUF3108 domain-containing protein [Thiotrichales bacterium]|jgi:hypothetical protein|nr:DUF3108 domain-containing protein [Thiotrichales bacterium]MBT3613482.1 DUF3108 domain-containing protein [Thiotrichales bacterium]MBT3753049.1 DUF3108 domain-containing protein [Thiotrichales bacterium]MBT3837332.1 DUF3108 domain-containing protein [Thiotrichales bacterium]MBT4151644.1 DUF3108 domain-containing protein [Thiotrichales bacterium]
MRKINRVVLTLLTMTVMAAISLLPAANATLPKSFNAEYELSGKGMVLGQTTYSLQGEQFSIRTKPTGLAALFVKKNIEESSRWRWHNGQIQPLHYIYSERGKRNRDRSRTFNWDNGTVSVEDDKNISLLKITTPAGDSPNEQSDRATDKALFILQLMDQLSGLTDNSNNSNNSRGSTTELNYRIAKTDGWHAYHFRLGEIKKIATPAGKFTAQQVIRESSGKRSFELWSAPELGYLPVLIEYREKDGSLFTLKLKRTTLMH